VAPPDQTSLSRRLTLRDAVALGLGSMIGAGLFSAFGPATRAAGTWMLLALALAAIVAFCNATSSAQLAAQYPTSGGTYVYGRERLGPWAGFFAGWSFVVGKTASTAAMALTVAVYIAPSGWERPVAAVAIVAVTTVNLFGVTRTARATRILVIVVLALLAVGLAAATTTGTHAAWGQRTSIGPLGILQGAGFLFFAFAGYARVATLGEEVVQPRKTIPRAIVTALAITVALYALVAVILLSTLGADRLAASTTPLTDAAALSPWPWAVPVVEVAAALAALGALLALVTGIGRTVLAMARSSDLPSWLAAVHPARKVPHHAEIALAVTAVVLVSFLDVRSAIGFSSFGVLLYYFIANWAALTQTHSDRRYPRILQILGMAGCVALVLSLPWQSIAGGIIVVGCGLVYRLVRRRLAPGTKP
jgi:basic amino acid/polyamine antiporter, APA family